MRFWIAVTNWYALKTCGSICQSLSVDEEEQASLAIT